MAGDERQRVAHDSLANDRAAAVGADQRDAADVSTFGLDRDPGIFNLESGYARAVAQLDQRRKRLAAVEERAVDIRPVRHGIGIAEALGEALVERHIDDLLAAHAVE